MPEHFQDFDGWVLVWEVAPVVLTLALVSCLISYAVVRVASMWRSKR